MKNMIAWILLLVFPLAFLIFDKLNWFNYYAIAIIGLSVIGWIVKEVREVMGVNKR